MHDVTPHTCVLSRDYFEGNFMLIIMRLSYKDKMSWYALSITAGTYGPGDVHVCVRVDFTSGLALSVS